MHYNSINQYTILIKNSEGLYFSILILFMAYSFIINGLLFYFILLKVNLNFTPVKEKVC